MTFLWVSLAPTISRPEGATERDVLIAFRQATENPPRQTLPFRVDSVGTDRARITLPTGVADELVRDHLDVVIDLRRIENREPDASPPALTLVRLLVIRRGKA